MKKAIYIALSLTLLGCSDVAKTETNHSADEGTTNSVSDRVELYGSSEPGGTSGMKQQLGEMTFHAHAVTALDYLFKKGESVQEGDYEALKDEAVVMVDFTAQNPHENIFLSEDMAYNRDDAIQYLIGDIQQDVKFIQGEKRLSANGVHYEGQVGPQNSFRVYFFVNGIDIEKEYQIEYYDQLFEKGLIKFKHTNTEIIS